tara:strand:- start:184 stop:555 length:372 start_codon:yes stop_codon:yes gene_type:complete
MNIKIVLIVFLASVHLQLLSQCNQHVFTSVGATEYTQYQYQDCEGLLHWFNLPIGGYTIILCADIGTAFVLNGDGFVYPLLTEHPAYASCIQIECPTDIDQNGTTDLNDLLLILQNYGTQCEN